MRALHNIGTRLVVDDLQMCMTCSKNILERGSRTLDIQMYMIYTPQMIIKCILALDPML
jgi:hypothetical protein